MNKLSFVGMQLPENIRRISTFRAKALRLELLVKVTERFFIFNFSVHRYLYKLYELHVSVENYTEAAFTLLLHADILKVRMLFNSNIFLLPCSDFTIATINQSNAYWAMQWEVKVVRGSQIQTSVYMHENGQLAC